ncbi:hypothetical protein D9758_010945 [Tetrapyrgos nigripes]|uniref:Autophagy-related protein 101 n=1 Tax=Tetrapyrgos nigripes TaxID=182062 RepID=A0A8H5CUL1_9AGAR|nr:hypothetical protein D9758_010945 [Tetrapyrgos nigripes]
MLKENCSSTLSTVSSSSITSHQNIHCATLLLRRVTMSSDHFNYAKNIGHYSSVAAAIAFALVYVLLFIRFIPPLIRQRSSVLLMMVLFCLNKSIFPFGSVYRRSDHYDHLAVRIGSFALRAVLASSDSAGENEGLFIADQILLSAGFIGLLYSTYGLGLDQHLPLFIAMNNYPTISIDLVLDRSSTREVLQAMLHAILFHRLFGTVKPKTFEVLDVTMPGVSDPDMEKLVDEKVDAFWKGIERGVSKRGQVMVTFSERKAKKGWFQMHMGEEDVPWEQWVINAEVRQPRDGDRQVFDTKLAATLTKSIQTMLTHTSSDRGRAVVPPITNASGISPFPFKISVQVGDQEF